MAPLVLWRHEIRRAGWAALLTPPVCAALVALLAVLQAANPGNEVLAARTLHAVLEQGIPLAVGVVAGSLIGRDPATELQLTVFRDYRGTLLRRLSLTLTWAGLIAVGTTVALKATGWWDRWPTAPAPVLGQLTWLAPTLWLAGLGFLAGAVLRSPAAAGGLVAGVWIAEQILANTMAGHPWTRSLNLFATTRGTGQDWLTNRLVLLGTGVALFVAAWVVLARTERLIKEQDA
jgi:hypothetical protein